MKRRGGLIFGGAGAIAIVAVLWVMTASASHPPATGQIVGHCLGWPNPRIEIRWHVNQPPGAPAPNSNSVLKDVNGTGNFWLYGGGPQVWGTRINGQPAPPTGPGPSGVHDLRDTAISPGNTYTYTAKYRPETSSSNQYIVTVNAANCGGASTPNPTPGPTPTPPPGAGLIRGVCRWVSGSPQVQLTWSQYPPPNQGAANSNSLQKGDSFPSDPNQYWGFLPNNPSQYAYNDSSVTLNTQYQYRVKYRADLPSVNTYNIYVSAANCGGPPPPPGPLDITPDFQTIPPNVTAFLSVSGGTGTYSWSAPTGTISGSGSQIGVTYTNNSTQPVGKTVTVTSGAQSISATVQVEGVSTYQDSIDLTPPGARRVIVNNDEPVTPYFDVGLTLTHGFAPTASADIQMRLSNTLAGVASAPLQPYQESAPWNLCDTPGYCNEGPYTVFAIYRRPSGEQSPIVMDNILYTYNDPVGPASVLINGGAATTDDRTVSLALEHGLGSIPPDEIGMQIANRADLVGTADILEFNPIIAGWDLCSGIGPTCSNGTRTVFVRYCGRGQCTTAQDSIQLQSKWPDWGIRINNDAPSTGVTSVTLTFNSFFNLPGTRMFVSNLDDFSDATARPFSATLPWDLCTNRVPCTNDTYPVYVRYENDNGLPFPEPDSPRYEDVILLTLATPSPTPAAILLDDGAAVTGDRLVSVRFSSPFGPTATGVSMRVVNENNLSQRDRDLIATQYGGGIESQPPANRPASATAVTDQNQRQPLPPQVGRTELESGTIRPYTQVIGVWDLCDGKTECPFANYKVYVQYYRSPSAGGADAGGSGTLAALGDEVSWVYYDTINFALVSPTPTPSLTPTPILTPTPSGTPTGTPTSSPGPGVGLPSWVPAWIVAIINALAEAEPLIGALAFASAVAVIISAIATILPLIGPGLAAFTWQSFMSVFGLLPRRKKVWGTVYDANTKRPIPYAKVQLVDRNRRVLETRVADKEGRYGFLTTAESLHAQSVQIAIVPSAAGYIFPSKVSPTIDTFIYNNLYFGDLITVSEKTLINFDIPMDPIRPSSAPLLTKSPSIALGASVAFIADAGFWLGLIFVPLSFILNPNPFTFGTLCLFLGTASLRLFGISEHPFGTVTDIQTGRAMPFALITVNDPATHKRIAFTVSDEQGRYFMVVEKGTYEVVAHTSALIQPPRQSTQTITAKKGWITRELKL